jgi:replicative DNA helicase
MELTTRELANIDCVVTNDAVKPIKEVADKQIDTGENYSIGFKEFDDVTEGGFKDGDLVIITGISGEGKTTYAQTLTYNLCKQAIPCLWFSYEVSIKHLDKKFREMGIDDFYYAFTPEKNTTGKLIWVKAKIKESWVKYATKVVFIDHIDFLAPTDVRSNDNETIILKKIATELKSLAIELGITIVTMAHIKKLPDGKEPEMQDIGYSAGIYQLADYVYIVMREKLNQEKGLSKYNNASGNIYTNKSIIKLVKNRATGITKYIVCQYANGKFEQPKQNDDYFKGVSYFQN